MRYTTYASLFLGVTFFIAAVPARCEIHTQAGASDTNNTREEKLTLDELGLNSISDNPTTSCSKIEWFVDNATKRDLLKITQAGALFQYSAEYRNNLCYIKVFKDGEIIYSKYVGQLDGAFSKELLTEFKKLPITQAAIPKDNCLKPDDKSNNWTENQLDVAKKSFGPQQNGGLIDATHFLSEDGIKILEERINRTVSQPNNRESISVAKIINNPDNYSYAVTVPKNGIPEQWYFAEQPWYKDQFKGPAPKPHFVLYKSGSDKMIQANLPPGVFDTGINSEAISTAIKEAESSRKSELADPTNIKKWPLPKGPIGYIGLVDGDKSDPVITALTDDVRNFPRMMNGLKPCQFVAKGGSDFIVVKSNPKEILVSQVQAMADADLKTIYLNLAGHGNKDGVYFKDSNGKSHILSPNDIADVINQFPKINFVVNTVACHGGGISKMMEAFNSIINGAPNRVRVFLQSKADGLNQEGRLSGTMGINGAPVAYSTYYQIFLTYFLNQGETYGNAHHLADEEVKKWAPVNPETWIPGLATRGN